MNLDIIKTNKSLVYVSSKNNSFAIVNNAEFKQGEDIYTICDSTPIDLKSKVLDFINTLERKPNMTILGELVFTLKATKKINRINDFKLCHFILIKK